MEGRNNAQKLIGSRWRLPLEWGLLFILLVVAIWSVTLSQQAPQLILLGLLLVLTFNFSLPPFRGNIGLVPLVLSSSLLVVGPTQVAPLFLVSFGLAEMARPLWRPLWENASLAQPTWSQRLSSGAVHLAALMAGTAVFLALGGNAPILEITLDALAPLVGLGLSLTAVNFFLTSLAAWLWNRDLRPFLKRNSLPLIGFTLLSQPFALLGAFIHASTGLSIFVIFCLGVMGVGVITWLSWQNRYMLEQRLSQFTRLNDANLSLRGTLDLDQVLNRARQQMSSLVPANTYQIQLFDAENTLGRPSLDDFSHWVLKNEKMLALDRGNMHYVREHNLQPPEPAVGAWLGIPLFAQEKVIGLMTLSRKPPAASFSRWNREVLLALAGQISAAIENARLYSETLRLYNLTDEALSRRVEQLQALLNSMTEGVLMVDQNGRILLVNEMAASLLGQEPDALTQTALIGGPAIGLRNKELNRRLAMLSSTTQRPAAPVIYATPPPKRMIERTDTAVHMADGRVVGWLMLFRDVTESLALTEQRADLTRMIVHDLRNPLTTLLSILELLNPPDDGVDGSPAPLRLARQEALDMLDMVDSLMDINRMEAGQIVVDAEAMHLPPLVKRVIDRLRPLAAQKQIALTFEFPAKLPAVWGDEEILRRVLTNLLDNGLKFTPAGGQVSGKLLPEPSLTKKVESGVRCILCDTGPGIPADARERVFERYIRTNPGGAQVRGTGLGLTFCKLAIEAHNGRIWVEDAADGKSQFVFTLPGLPV